MYLTGLDPGWEQGRRTCYWYMSRTNTRPSGSDYDQEATSYLYNYASSGGSVTFSGLQSNTTYYFTCYIYREDTWSLLATLYGSAKTDAAAATPPTFYLSKGKSSVTFNITHNSYGTVYVYLRDGDGNVYANMVAVTGSSYQVNNLAPGTYYGNVGYYPSGSISWVGTESITLYAIYAYHRQTGTSTNIHAMTTHNSPTSGTVYGSSYYLSITGYTFNYSSPTSQTAGSGNLSFFLYYDKIPPTGSVSYSSRTATSLTFSYSFTNGSSNYKAVCNGVTKTMSSNSGTITFTGLSPGTSYTCYIYDVSYDQYTALDSASGTTASITGTISASAASSTSMSLSFSLNYSYGYRLYRSTSYSGTKTLISSGTASSGSYTDTGLSPATSYYYWLYDSDGNQLDYDVATTTTPTYTVSYNNNGGSGSISSQTKTYNIALTLSGGSGFSRTNYTLTKWNTAANGGGTDYALGDSYTANADVTLYAIWTKNTISKFTWRGSDANDNTYITSGANVSNITADRWNNYLRAKISEVETALGMSHATTDPATQGGSFTATLYNQIVAALTTLANHCGTSGVPASKSQGDTIFATLFNNPGGAAIKQALNNVIDYFNNL